MARVKDYPRWNFRGVTIQRPGQLHYCTLGKHQKGSAGQLIPQNTRYSAGLATLGCPLLVT